MASDVQDGGRKSREHNLEIGRDWAIILLTVFCNDFDQQHDRNNSYFAKITKNDGWIQDGGSKSIFFSTTLVK
jgi:hypothetical protein